MAKNDKFMARIKTDDELATSVTSYIRLKDCELELFSGGGDAIIYVKNTGAIKFIRKTADLGRRSESSVAAWQHARSAITSAQNEDAFYGTLSTCPHNEIDVLYRPRRFCADPDLPLKILLEVAKNYKSRTAKCQTR